MNPSETDFEPFKKRIADLWMHQNNLFWNRLQTASGIELGGLAGAYLVYEKGHYWWPVAVLALASFLLIGVFGLMVRDVVYREEICNLTASGEIIPKAGGKTLTDYREIVFPEKIFGANPTADVVKHLKGKHIGFYMILGTIVFNLVVALRMGWPVISKLQLPC